MSSDKLQNKLLIRRNFEIQKPKKEQHLPNEKYSTSFTNRLNEKSKINIYSIRIKRDESIPIAIATQTLKNKLNKSFLIPGVDSINSKTPKTGQKKLVNARKTIQTDRSHVVKNLFKLDQIKKTPENRKNTKTEGENLHLPLKINQIDKFKRYPISEKGITFQAKKLETQKIDQSASELKCQKDQTLSIEKQSFNEVIKFSNFEQSTNKNVQKNTTEPIIETNVYIRFQKQTSSRPYSKDSSFVLPLKNDRSNKFQLLSGEKNRKISDTASEQAKAVFDKLSSQILPQNIKKDESDNSENKIDSEKIAQTLKQMPSNFKSLNQNSLRQDFKSSDNNESFHVIKRIPIKIQKTKHMNYNLSLNNSTCNSNTMSPLNKNRKKVFNFASVVGNSESLLEKTFNFERKRINFISPNPQMTDYDSNHLNFTGVLSIKKCNSVEKVQKTPQKTHRISLHVPGQSKSTSIDKTRHEKTHKTHNILTNTISLKKRKDDNFNLKPIKQELRLLRENLIKKIQNSIKLDHNVPKTTLEYFKFIRIIGEGNCGKVFLAESILCGRLVAIKQIKRSKILEKDDKNKFLQEIAILKELSHKNIIKIFEVFENSVNIFLVTEYAPNGDLISVLKEKGIFSEENWRKILFQLIEGLAYLQSKNVIHRDIKLDNILMSENGVAKFCDFGVARIYRPNTVLKECVGTPAYQAPEMLSCLGYSGFASDVWSLGVTSFIALTGQIPFKGQTIQETREKIVDTIPQLPARTKLSEEMKSVLFGMLEKDPEKRISIEEITGKLGFSCFFSKCKEPKEFFDDKILEKLKLIGYPKRITRVHLKNQVLDHINTLYSLLET